MTENYGVMISLTLYKVASLCVGWAFGWMGYRLFMAGVWGNAGDLSAKYGDNKLVLKSAAPGTFFALFGTVIIAVTIWQGYELSTTTGIDQSAVDSAFDELPNEPPF